MGYNPNSYTATWMHYFENKTLEDIRDYEEMSMYDVSVEYFLVNGDHTEWFPPPRNGWRISCGRMRESSTHERFYYLTQIVKGKYVHIATFHDYAVPSDWESAETMPYYQIKGITKYNAALQEWEGPEDADIHENVAP
jgi:hypothetical protein